ncbi:ParB/Srx family N-terminal domain-containing protein [Bordetella genomosp. 13]|uniref:Chromosome partitioning protein ParB n=1 Tax=Bordetella genomosp. 13 TaxID=463040 RepID=A0A1W6ZJL6_9BORD|nr:ParB/Srx family N-terminal domain-containing protein [Bordetella genomosp. 13]ARP97519.1 chromosome partitioning protein ParB [Bordetella genomosp. 13]
MLTESPSKPWMPLRRRATHLIALALIPLALAACGGSDDDDDEVADNTPPVTEPAPTPPEDTPSRNTAYLGAKSGDILKVRIEELIPTQPGLGYDQVYYKLGRWQGDFDRPTWAADPVLQLDYLNRTVGKKFGDYCEDTGQHDVVEFTSIDAVRAARLDDPSTFECQSEPGADPDDKAAMKTVVIGWDGNLYLTDGHHSFSSLREIADGGPKLEVYVRVDANYSDLPTREAFWQRMVDENKTWLRDGDNNSITVDQLPTRLGLANDTEPGGMAEDRYRSLVYFTRDIAYVSGDLPEFAEFLWGDWIRRKQTAGQIPALSHYNMVANATNVADVLAESALDENLLKTGDDFSYPAAVRDVSLIMGTTSEFELIYGSTTATELGRIALVVPNDPDTEDALGELEDIARDDTNGDGEPRGAGKLWFSANYRACGKPAAGTCWGY